MQAQKSRADETEIISAPFSTVISCFFLLGNNLNSRKFASTLKRILFSWIIWEQVASPLLCHLWMAQCIFPTYQNFLLHNHHTDNKTRRMMFVPSYRPICQEHSCPQLPWQHRLIESWIAFGQHVALVSFDLEQFLNLYLTLMSVAPLRITGW